jgi:hypothetical protein
LFLRNTRVVGELDLDACHLATRLRLERCAIESPVYLEQAQAPDIRLIACALNGGVEASQLSVGWNLWLDESTLAQPLRLSHAKIGGQLGMVGTFLYGEPGAEAPMVQGDGLKVGNGAYLREGFTSLGQIRLVGASIEGQLDLSNARLSCSNGPSLMAPELSVSRSLLATGMRSGEIDLSGASIGGDLMMRGAKLTGGEEAALMARSLKIGGHLECSEGFSAAGDLVLSYASIGAHLAFNEARVDGQLVLYGGVVKTQFGFERATLVGPKQTGEPQVSLNADYLRVGGGMHCSGLSAEGQFRLPGATIGGQLNLRDATLDGGVSDEHRLEALVGHGLRVRDGVFCVNGFSARGDLNFLGAHVDAGLSLQRARVENGEVVLSGAVIAQQLTMGRAELRGREEEGAAALTASSAEIGDMIFCDGLVAKGAINLAAAKIGSGLSMHGVTIRGPVVLNGASVGGNINLLQATLDGGEGPALVGRRLYVEGDMQCQDGVAVDGGFGVFKSVGEIHLPASTIDGKLIVSGAFLTGSKGLAEWDASVALALVGARIDGLVLCPERVEGSVDLRDLTVRILSDFEDGSFYGLRCEQLRLDGFTYASLQEPLDASQRLAWIAPSQTETHSPEVFIELANAFRRIGRSSDMRKVLIANQRRAYRELKKAGQSPLVGERIGLALRRGWHNLLYVTVGYGYRNWLAVGWLGGLLALGFVVFSLEEASFDPARANVPGFQPLLYAIDVTIPAIDLGQQGAWIADDSIRWVSLALAVAGYALATAVVAAAAGLLRRGEQ